MSAEQSFGGEPLDTLARGLHIRRQAAGFELGNLVFDIAEFADNNPGVEARQINDGRNPNRTIGLNIVSRPEVREVAQKRTRSLPGFGRIPMQKAVDAVLTGVPSLLYDVDVSIERVDIQKAGDNYYVIGVFDQISEADQVDERLAVIGSLDRLVRHQPGKDWRSHRPDVTLAFISGHQADIYSARERLLDVIIPHLDIPVTLLAADINDNEYHQK